MMNRIHLVAVISFTLCLQSAASHAQTNAAGDGKPPVALPARLPKLPPGADKAEDGLPGPGNISAPYTPSGSSPAPRTTPGAPSAKSNAPPSVRPETKSNEDYTIVDASDLIVGSKKYINRNIVLPGMQCYYADVSDYRCTASGGTVLAIFTKTVEPTAAREWLEKYCEKLMVAMSSEKCRFNPQFSYDADNFEEDIIPGHQQRRVIRTVTGVTMVSESKLRAPAKRR